MIMSNSKLKLLLSASAVCIIAALSVTACSQYNADIPEYTTGDDRSSLFRASTFEEQHNTVAPEKHSIGDVVDEGVASVQRQASQFAAEQGIRNEQVANQQNANQQEIASGKEHLNNSSPEMQPMSIGDVKLSEMPDIMPSQTTEK